jgi:hypothetical protein
MNPQGKQIMDFAKGKVIQMFVPMRDGFLMHFTNGESLSAEVVQTGNNEVTMKYGISGRVTSFNGQPIVSWSCHIVQRATDCEG